MSSAPVKRVEALAGHLTAAPAKAQDRVAVVSALRTPITKARKGGFKDTTADTLLATVLTAVLDSTKGAVTAADVEDVCVGNVLTHGASNMARIAQLCAKIPYSVPLSTVNRQCSSGLEATMIVASKIASGQIDVGIGAGVESMTNDSMGGMGAPKVDWGVVGDVPEAQACLTPMGITSENVAERFGVSREKQDAFAKLSHDRAAAARAGGLFDAEIVPVATTRDDEEVTIAADDGIREGTTVEKLAKLRGAFKPDGSTTAGNSSQVSDGAAAVLLMRESKAKTLGLPVLGYVTSYAVVGVDPSVMGIGPAVAIPKALKAAGLTVDDIDVFELNEAFASQAVYCVERLGIPVEKVNPKGGAIALGHPLGCTGARQIATALHELKRTKKRRAVVSMCIGTGMGAAAVFETA